MTVTLKVTVTWFSDQIPALLSAVSICESVIDYSYCANGWPLRADSTTCKMAAMLTLAVSVSIQKEA